MPSQLRKEQSSASVDEIIVIVSRQTSWKRIRESYVSNGNKIVPTNTEQYTMNDILLPNKNTAQSPKQTYVDFVMFMMRKSDQYKSMCGYKAKSEFRVSIINHLTANGRRFFGYDKSGKMVRVSEEWVSEKIKNIFSNHKR
jgi:hypothetical protein